MRKISRLRAFNSLIGEGCGCPKLLRTLFSCALSGARKI